MEKRCLMCGETKPASEFYASKFGSLGLYTYCKPCQITKVARMKKERPKRFQAPEGMKRCCTCKEIKPLDDFTKDSTAYDGRAAFCRVCSRVRANKRYGKERDHIVERARQWRRQNPDRVRDATLKKNYGLVYGTYDTLHAKQRGRCAICKTSDTGARFRLHVDHDHDTGQVRGLLCGRCNTGIGQLKHSPTLLRAAIRYLKVTPVIQTSDQRQMHIQF